MSSAAARSSPFGGTPVTLPPQQWGAYTDSSYEPQYTTSKRPNRGWTYLDSKNTTDTDKTSCTIAPATLLGTGFNRINVEGFTINWFIPNVNERNNQITVLDELGNPYSCYIAPGYYDNPQTLAEHIRDQLNAISGLPFVFSLETPSSAPADRQDWVPLPDAFILAATGLYRFDDRCSVVNRGSPCYNISKGSTLSTRQIIGPMGMMYTQYVDIQSRALTQWTKIPSTTTGALSSVVARAYVGGSAYGVQFQQFEQNVSLSWNAGCPLSLIDISLFDSNGDPLYAPYGGTKLEWQLALSLEL